MSKNLISNGEYWLSTPKFTALAIVNNDIIVDSAPIFNKFINQPAINLWTWLDNFKPFYYSKLT